MTKNSSNLLEPRLTEEQCKEKALRSLLISKPDIVKMSRSSVLDQVKSFLPKMADAEVILNKDIDRGLAQQYNIENVAQDDKVVEMDLAVMKENESWTSDSEPDSEPSETCNDFTSDTDISSTTPCSSSSNSPACSPRSSSRMESPPPPAKRPLIEEMDSSENKKLRTSS